MDANGLLYLRARYADPATGRFLSPDSVQPNAPDTQGYHRYSYVANNPTTWTDPTGYQVATQPVLNPNWLPIAISIALGYVGLACAYNPLVCTTALGHLAIFAIMVLVVVACVLEVGGPCWTVDTVEQTRTRTKEDVEPRPLPTPLATPPGPITEPRPTCNSPGYSKYIRCDNLPSWGDTSDGSYDFSSEEEALKHLKRESGFHDAAWVNEEPDDATGALVAQIAASRTAHRVGTKVYVVRDLADTWDLSCLAHVVTIQLGLPKSRGSARSQTGAIGFLATEGSWEASKCDDR
jgi:RHS repeat-associated protein